MQINVYHLFTLIGKLSSIHKNAERLFSLCNSANTFLIASGTTDQRPVFGSRNKSSFFQSFFRSHRSIIKSGADNIRNCTIWIIFCKNICHSRFGDLRAPTKNSCIIERGFAGFTYQCSIIDIRLQCFHYSIIEEQCLCIIQRSHKEFYCF